MTKIEALNAADLEGVTIILRNLASKYTQNDVKRILDESGLRGSFAFVYVPCIEARKCNLGYGFVRFRTQEAADKCFRVWNGRIFGGAGTKKACQVDVAMNQSSADLIKDKKRRKQRGKSPEILVCDDPMPSEDEGSASGSTEVESSTLSELAPADWEVPPAKFPGFATREEVDQYTFESRPPLIAETTNNYTTLEEAILTHIHQERLTKEMLELVSYSPSYRAGWQRQRIPPPPGLPQPQEFAWPMAF
mmetsp:Transcript_46507/g.92135  ORF Transcript_46507/g.92135 Transcript_46507/m.92135 type:complete len:249 (-) Transcript_46507:32-778(-)